VPAIAIVLALLLSGCASRLPPLPTVENLDLNRYMGKWYVIACIPTFIETEAYNAVETYRLESDGTIDTVFTFNQGSFDGPAKRYNPRGFVRDPVHKSTWGMRFVWPFQAEFLVTHVDPDYTRTVIGRNKRDYLWISPPPTMIVWCANSPRWVTTRLKSVACRTVGRTRMRSAELRGGKRGHFRPRRVGSQRERAGT